MAIWKPIALALLERGHNITMLSSYPDNQLEASKNINLIVVEKNTQAAEEYMASKEIFEGLDPLMNATRGQEFVKKVN